MKIFFVKHWAFEKAKLMRHIIYRIGPLRIIKSYR